MSEDKDKNMTVIQWRVTNCDENLDYSILQGNRSKKKIKCSTKFQTKIGFEFYYFTSIDVGSVSV